jgi:DNA-binding response OmpR family regulator
LAQVALRPKKFDLLAVLTASPGKVMTRAALMADIWDGLHRPALKAMIFIGPGV